MSNQNSNSAGLIGSALGLASAVISLIPKRSPAERAVVRLAALKVKRERLVRRRDQADGRARERLAFKVRMVDARIMSARIVAQQYGVALTP